MNLVAFMSSRFNDRRTLPRSIRVMRAVAVTGIAVAVAALVVALSIGHGFESRYRHSLLDFNAHVVVTGKDIEQLANKMALIESFRYLSEDDERFAKRWQWLLPWRERILYVGSVIDSLYESVARALLDFPRLASLWESVNPQKLWSNLPGGMSNWLERLADSINSGVVATTPFLYREALVVGGGEINGIVVKGVDPQTMGSVNAMPIKIFDAGVSFEDALRFQTGLPPPVIAGKALARVLNITNESKEVKLLIPRETLKKDNIQIFDTVRIVGIFESGMHDYDAQFLLMSLPVVRLLFHTSKEDITGIELKLDNADKATSIAAAIEERLGPHYSAITWSDLNRELLSAVKLEQLVSAIIMGVMVIVAALNIVAVLVLMTIYRLHEISVIRALGLKRSVVQALLVRGGTSLGFLGALAGLILGIATSFVLERFELVRLDPEVYLIKSLPIDISPALCGMIAAFCCLVGFLTSRAASKRLASVPIVEGLQIAR